MKETIHLKASPCLLTTKKEEERMEEIKMVSLIDFLKQHNSDLLDFVGFNFISDMEEEPIFDEHTPIIEARKKIR